MTQDFKKEITILNMKFLMSLYEIFNESLSLITISSLVAVMSIKYLQYLINIIFWYHSPI